MKFEEKCKSKNVAGQLIDKEAELMNISTTHRGKFRECR